MVLETVAGVPDMVGGSRQHLRAQRRMESDHGWIHILLEEAENQRMHLMTFIHITQPARFPRDAGEVLPAHEHKPAGLRACEAMYRD